MSAFYAHSKPGEPPEKWHNLEDHLRATAEQAKEFLEPFGAGDWAYLAGCLHDLGKYSKEFQDRLPDTADNENNMDSKPGRVDHSSAGAQEIVQRYPELGRLMTYCLTGHHAGLLNGKDIMCSCLDARFKKSIPECRSASDFFLARIPALNGFPLDLKLLWDALVNMFDYDHSAACGKMCARKLVVFKHATALGNAPAHKLFDCVKVTRASDPMKPARSFSDYKVDICRDLPAGVTLEERL